MRSLAILLALSTAGCNQMLSQDTWDAMVRLRHEWIDENGDKRGYRSSAWLVHNEGGVAYFQTAHHVTSETDTLKVIGGRALPIGTELHVHAVDKRNDLAVLRTDGSLTDAEPIPICEDDASIGDRVMVLGYTDDGAELYGGSVISKIRWLTTTAVGLPGMSGGPVVNKTGECAYSVLRGGYETDSGYVGATVGAKTKYVRRLIDTYM